MAGSVVRGRGSVLGTPSVHFFCSILVRGDVSGLPRSSDRNRVTTSTGRYGSAYPCTTGSGGICIVRFVPARAAGGRGYATCIVPFLALSLFPSQCEYLYFTGFPPQLLY